MATVYSRRFYTGGTNAANTTLWTVPPNKLHVIKFVSLVLTASGAVTTLNASGGAGNIIRYQSAAANGYLNQELFQVVPAGENVFAILSGGGSVYMYASGYELDTLNAG
jgi:hypothetical protein